MTKQFASLPTIYPTELAQKGVQIYRKMAKRLEKKHTGEFVAIEVRSKKYFLGETQVEALKKAKKHFPNKIFYLMKIGFPGAVSISTYHRPVSYGNVL